MIVVIIIITTKIVSAYYVRRSVHRFGAAAAAADILCRWDTRTLERSPDRQLDRSCRRGSHVL